MFDEEMLDEVTTTIKILDALYMSELDLDECTHVLNTISMSFFIGKNTGMNLNKESIKDLRDSMQKDIDEYNKKKADETIIDFLK